MFHLKNCTVRFKLSFLIGVFLFAFASFGSLVYQVLTLVKVSGSNYGRVVQGKDLIAEIVPLPACILEAYLVTLQMTDKSDREELEQWARKLRGLSADYKQRHALWVRHLPEGALKDGMVARSYQPAQEFFDVTERKFIPAVLKGDLQRAKKLSRGILKRQYEDYRIAMDEVVRTAKERNKADEQTYARLIKSITVALVACGIGLVVIVSSFSLLVAVQIARPLGQTVKVLEAAAAGDLGKRLDIKSRDEVGRIATALNAILDAWHSSCEELKRIGQTEKQQGDALKAKIDGLLSALRAAAKGDLTQKVPVGGADAIGQLGEELALFLSELQGSISSTARNTTRLTQSSNALTVASQETHLSAKEVSVQANAALATVEQVSKNIQTVATGSEGLNTCIQEIVKNANELAQAGVATAKVVETAHGRISKLHASSAQIGQGIEAITSIAEHANLLALNAIIEAARAGEAGKGFVVVAHEVKELARQITQATGSIRNRIAEIEADTRDAAAAMSEIGTTLHQINGIQNANASTVEHQAVIARELRIHVAEAVRESEEITHSIAGVAQLAQSTEVRTNDIQSMADELFQIAREIQRLVSCFDGREDTAAVSSELGELSSATVRVERSSDTRGRARAGAGSH